MFIGSLLALVVNGQQNKLVSHDAECALDVVGDEQFSFVSVQDRDGCNKIVVAHGFRCGCDDAVFEVHAPTVTTGPSRTEWATAAGELGASATRIGF